MSDWDVGCADRLAGRPHGTIHCTKRTPPPIQRATSMARLLAAKDGYRTRPATLTPEKSILPKAIERREGWPHYLTTSSSI
jgi:hypothetical protein